MKTTHRLLALAGLLTAGSMVRADEPALVLAPAVRKEAVARAEALLSHKMLRLAPDLVDPFHSQAFAEATGHVVHATEPAAGKTGPRSDHDVLAGIASGLTPTGAFVMDGQRILIFGQKRVKPGTTLTINFEGAEYIVEITAIDNTSFTLRLNREEFTRPIK